MQCDFEKFCVTRSVSYDQCAFKHCPTVVFYSNSDWGDRGAQCDNCHGQIFCNDHLDDHPCGSGKWYCESPNCVVIIDFSKQNGCNKEKPCCNNYFCSDHRSDH